MLSVNQTIITVNELIREIRFEIEDIVLGLDLLPTGTCNHYHTTSFFDYISVCLSVYICPRICLFIGANGEEAMVASTKATEAQELSYLCGHVFLSVSQYVYLSISRRL